ncbi:hypothetical protein [Natrinema salaciae]|uniref:Uncharacterized protein n=1 Tax=Natrinema salaciae TaxID=1186196 RepID=A0A1H9K6R0_9EURY|nr:hypothetical protein [Natrinema salaciae]SEQ94627.1 hypothetical protein SAMN04489841_2816 [Natrinema salaciae]
MSIIVDLRSVTMLPIANVAIPTALILLILLVGGLISGGLLFGLAYLIYRFTRGSEARTGQ